MKKLLTTTAIVAGALWFGPAQAGVADAFCGPLAEGGCGDGNKIFLDQANNVTTVTGNVGGNNASLPAVKITSDHFMMLTITLDSGGGFATITPGLNGGKTFFNGIDFSIPGYEFSKLIFSVQMQQRTNEATDAFTIDGFRGVGLNRLADNGLIGDILFHQGDENSKTDTDREFSITALAGAFDDVDIFSSSGFHEIKHLKVEGLCQIQDNGTCIPTIIDAAEPASLAVLGFGMLGLAAVRRKNLSIA